LVLSGQRVDKHAGRDCHKNCFPWNNWVAQRTQMFFSAVLIRQCYSGLAATNCSTGNNLEYKQACLEADIGAALSKLRLFDIVEKIIDTFVPACESSQE
jgi:hypothetical protein